MYRVTDIPGVPKKREPKIDQLYWEKGLSFPLNLFLGLQHMSWLFEKIFTLILALIFAEKKISRKWGFFHGRIYEFHLKVRIC